MKAKYVQDWSLVELPDKRIGVYTRQGPYNSPVVHTKDGADDLGVEIKLSTELIVLKHPAELAFEALRTYEADASAAHHADQWKASPC